MNLRQILVETFKKTKIPEDIGDLKMGDFDEWDSIGNFNLLLAVEESFQIEFDFNELETTTSVHQIQKKINDLYKK